MQFCHQVRPQTAGRAACSVTGAFRLNHFLPGGV